MPLSENEQRILRQIEQQLERDPTFSTRGPSSAARRVVGLSIAVVGALTVTVLLLSASVWLSIGAFVGTLLLAVALEREVRLIAVEKVGALPVSAWLGGGRGRTRGRPSAESPTEEYDG